MKNRKYTKTITCVLIIVIMTTLSGCDSMKLAKNDGNTAPKGDVFSGLFLMTKSEVDKVIDNNKGKMGYIEEITIEGKKDKEDKYVFGDIRGHYIAHTVEGYESEGVMEKPGTFHASGDIYDVNFVSASSDETEELTGEGTCSIAKTGKQLQYVANKMYQRSDGSVYIKIHGGPSMSMGTSGGGGLGVSEDVAITESSKYSRAGLGDILNQNIKKEKRSFQINLEPIDYLVGGTIKEMSKEDILLKTQSVNLEKLKWNDENIVKLSQDTAYVIVEEQFRDEKDLTYIKRSVYDCERIVNKDSGDNNLKEYSNGEDEFLYEAQVEHGFLYTDSENVVIRKAIVLKK